MGKLRKLRSRFISSVGAVKRSILRMQSQGSSASNSTALTSLTPGGEDEDGLPTTSQASNSSKNAGISIWRKMGGPEENQGRTGQQLKLHWSEGRRIYSEPMHSMERVSCSRGEQDSDSSSSSASTTEVEPEVFSKGAAPDLVSVVSLETRTRKAATAVAGSTQALASGSAGEIGVTGCSLSSDEEDNDDVFLESWEDHQREKGIRDLHDYTDEDFLLGDGGSFSGFSSGYSTISNDNLPSPALYLPPPTAEGTGTATSEGEPREGGVSGWDDWRIAESEVSLGPVLTATEQETTYSGYWHGHVQVRSRKVREVEDLTCFLEEVTTLSCIRHENIQLFMGACLNMQEGVLAIVMSEIKGDSLHTRLHHCGHAFTNPSKIKILSQIAEGMAYLHARGIPHGLLSSSSVSLHFRVCISLAPQYSRSKARQLQPCDIPYLPPECIRELHVSHSRSHVVAYGSPLESATTGKRRGHSCSSQRKFSTGHFVATQTATGRNERRACVILLEGRPTLFADIFAFGTIIYELMSLEHPYKSYPLETQIWRVGKGKVQGLMLLPRGQLRSLIACCWKENPDHRPAFKEVLAMLEQDAINNWTFGSVRSLPCLSSSSSISMHSPPDTPSIVRNNY